MKKTKDKMQIFAEVITDYTDPETGNIKIDAYPNTNPYSETGRTVAEVTRDGEVILGKNPVVKASDLKCSLVVEAIKEVQEEQKTRKQIMVDEVIERIKEDIEAQDITAIDELLMFCPAKYLKGYLSED